ncbi:MAG: site-2 protease family protein [Planctomycetota bacterium]
MQTLISILQVAAGLGFVIFVHELGHFLVAKACGVRCDKFMVGFDIGGLKIGKQWGETFYGIGILPLGGYVKMYGQEDNVAAIAEEMEKAKTLEGDPNAKQVTGPDGNKVWIDKRSYLAKSVPQRMAIISAGVIMNVIFAFIFAWVAFGLGVPETPAVVGGAVPGSPGWEAGLQTGDRFVKINEIEDPNYQELVEEVILGDLDAGIDCVIETAGGTTRELNLKPRKTGKMPQIGIAPPTRPVLASKDAVVPNTPAAELGEDGFEDGDHIIAIGDTTIDSYADLAAVLKQRASESLTYTVLRGGKAPKDDPYARPVDATEVEITVGPNPMERLGIVPRLGEVVSMSADSPAAEAGLEVGDQITKLNGVAIGTALEGEEAIDTVLLDNRLAGIAERGEAVTLTVQRGDETLDIKVTPRVATWRSPDTLRAPKALDELGIACRVEPVIEAIVGGSPAASADLKPGDHLISVTLKSTNEDDNVRGGSVSVPLNDNVDNVAALLEDLQDKSSDFSVELVIARPKPDADGELTGGEPTRTVSLKPETVSDAYTTTRGVRITPLERIGKADSFEEKTTLAWEATTRALTTVVRFIQGLGSGQVSMSGAGGPITIAAVAGDAASRGMGALLMSLTMLSANLAVLNFLPIPVLDGGHMVFLLYEGITGRPVNEKIMIALQTLGLFFLLGLMLFVTTMDIGRLVTWFS